ncbi:AcrB/AcrD/AcrF family protein [Stakelama saccharophila]|uniref:AcrB/AcrD/AcrF family protein n=1 Tax=Stakelama saccharophila TaxID=3075605 RepID=A0ABZ0BAX6_9SPHN|nr:AcrB/AcrD/AcrF family protein [Stakelama sp. W311]WNO54362.1 AcrB/AcrD/AcrF family protein [Stakelama sp. W311]
MRLALPAVGTVARLIRLPAGDTLARLNDRYWLRASMLVWLGVAIWFFWDRWPYIYWLALRDTDDNMRLMQVRALLSGQGWYDLTNYRLNPPQGFNIHWSRIVDLPIAGLILFFRLFTSNWWAERLAAGIAPLIPLSVVIGALGFTVRRLVGAFSWPLMIAMLLLSSGPAILMFYPMRIDHHGWQLAALTLTVAGLADDRRVRGGAIIGASSAFSLAIGLEMLPYCAMAGAILTLRWIWDRDDARRLLVYALTLGGGVAIGFAGFASYANRAMRCDALTPVYLATVTLSAALLFVLAWVNPRARLIRLTLAVLAGAAIAAAFAAAFPQCLGRPEGASPELYRVWLDNVREAKPIYEHPLRNIVRIATLPVIGLIGAIVATVVAWRRGRFMLWLPAALFTAFACAMLLWQVRAGPAAELLALPGATALAWIVIPWLVTRRGWMPKVVGAGVGAAILAAVFAGVLLGWFRVDPMNEYHRVVNRANARCASYSRLKQLDRLPPQVIFTHVDLGPRLVTVTHHDAVAGPYHRNGPAILDVHHAFEGTPERAHRIMKRHHATLLLVCPNMSETTVYRASAPDGFYARLSHDKVPGWLTPVELPKDSPFRAWRIR